MTPQPWADPELTSRGRLPMHAVPHEDRLPLDGTWRFQLLHHPTDQVDGADEGGILFLADAFERLVVHGQHFAGMGNLHAFIVEVSSLAGAMNFSLIADEVNRGDRLVSFECLFDAFDDDRTTVVATHDIHCNSHK